MSKTIDLPEGYEAVIIKAGTRWMFMPDEVAPKRLKALRDHVKQTTSLAAMRDFGNGDIARLALLRGLAQLEAERDALANPEPVKPEGGRPWPYVGQDDAVSLTEAGEEAVNGKVETMGDLPALVKSYCDAYGYALTAPGQADPASRPDPPCEPT